jgi:hypothetical protein
MSDNTQPIAFWQLLQQQKIEKIEIPIIQRDYAQGRKGKEALREKLLGDLKKTLLPNGETLKLDFVYGSVENGNFNPLDGQQRLTTLWLLHWYIAYKAGELADNKDIFKRFTYETRVSSREFCEKLSELEPDNGAGIVEHITSQTWFYSAWKQDPTIQAMLNMLGGTPKKNDKNEDIVDGIEELFINCSQEGYKEYWKKLTKDNSIIFYNLPLHELKLSDDLYIKMNARGKQLTNFENFKADLVGHIREKGWENDKETQDTIAHKLDTSWTEIFWKNKSSECKIDEIYFAFLNRYFLNALITATKTTNGSDYLFKGENLEKNKTYQYLISEKEYSGFGVYNPKIGDEEVFTKDVYRQLENTLDNFYNALKSETREEINKLFLPVWGDDKFKLIPEYEKNKEYQNTITQPQRVVFYAICRYFEVIDEENQKNQYDKKNLKQWLRVVWNIVENSSQSMIGQMRLIHELSNHSHDIYSHLKNGNLTSKFAEEQMKEEKEKARQIIDNPSWEEKIIKAEKTAFFKGAIRFMFTKEDVAKEDGSYDWNLFDDRLKKSEKYFDKAGVSEDYKNDALLLRALISKFTKWNDFTYDDSNPATIHYNSNTSTWKNDILTSKKYIHPVSKMFDEEDVKNIDFQNFTSSLNNSKGKLFQEDLVKSPFLSKIESGCIFHWWNYDGKYSLYPYNTKTQRKIYVLADKRNEVLSRLNVESQHKLENLPYFWGWDIYFKYNGKEYCWQREDFLQEKGENEAWVKVENVTLDNLEEYLRKVQ